MRILLVTSVPIEYNSSHNLLNRALLKGFTELGHEVASLSMRPQVDAMHYESNLLLPFFRRYFIEYGSKYTIAAPQKKDSVLIASIKRKLYRIRQSFSMYDSRAKYGKLASKIKLGEDYDLMISSSDPKSSHLFAHELLKNNKGRIRKWAQYWGDPFSSDINAGFAQKGNRAKDEEYRLLSCSDLVVYVSPFTLSNIQKQFISLADKCFWLPPPFIEPRIYKEPRNSRLRLIYAGNYYKKDRNLQPLVEAVKKVSFAELIIVGESDMVIPSISNIEVHGRVSFAQVVAYEESSDILVCVLNRKGTQIPAKLYQYAGTNRRVLVCYEDKDMMALEAIFPSTRFSFVPNQVDAIFNEIKQLREEKYTSFSPMNEFSASSIAEQFVSLASRELTSNSQQVSL